MENATKALLMAASVLIGMLVLTMGVYLYSTIGTYVRQSQEEIEKQSIDKFNIQFYNYLSDENEEFSFQDVVTVANIAYSNNYKYEFPNVKFNNNGTPNIPDEIREAIANEGKNDYVQVIVKGYMIDEENSTNNQMNLEMYVGTPKILADTLKKNYSLKYKCVGVETSSETKKVYKISFTKIEI